MYQAIVFLPLLGAILAGAIIALVRRARARFPGARAVATTITPCRTARARRTRRATRDHDAHDDHGHGPAEPAAAGSRAAEIITTSLLFIAVVLSWIAFCAGRLRPPGRAHRAVPLDDLGRPQGRLGAAHRHADRRDAGGGDHGVGARAPLFDRLHGRGPVPAALLRLSVAVHLRDADAGDRPTTSRSCSSAGRASASRAIC